MAITKRARFEVLRRDDHTCQYCGEKAPNVTLHIDHVEPVALGGSDKPDNLVTACKDCNAGKTSIAPDSPLVSTLSARASAYALGMVDKMTRVRAALEEADDFCAEFDDIWTNYTIDGKPIERPIDYEATLHRWFSQGVPIRLVELAVKRAMALERPSGEFGRFRYMCGVVWKQVDDSGIDYSLDAQTVSVYTEAESQRAYYAAHARGFGRGYEKGQTEMEQEDLLRRLIDGELAGITGG